MVIGVEEAVANYKTAKPLLFQKTTPGNTGSNQTPPATPDAGDRGATVKGLKPEDYRQKKSEVLSALRTVK